ncbi:UNVERIFIED_CONTAM: hypothetical protein FKN15_069199 [Acipenser sinensis]
MRESLQREGRMISMSLHADCASSYKSSVGFSHYEPANSITSSDLSSPVSEQHEGLYNGQVLLILPSISSCWAPGFNIELCRGLLARQGIQIPAEDLDQPLHSSLDRPEVKRYLLFNSTLFHLFLAPLLYLVTWCGLYSTFHLFLQGSLGSFFWLFCLSLSLLSVLLTAMILLLLNRHTRQEMAYQLLLTYSAVYVKLLVAQRLPREQRHLHAWRANAPCLCQYIEKLLLR